MVYLHMVAQDFGIKAETVRAAYASQAEAEAQANHNIETGKQRPLRIIDESGNLLKEYPQ